MKRRADGSKTPSVCFTHTEREKAPTARSKNWHRFKIQANSTAIIVAAFTSLSFIQRDFCLSLKHEHWVKRTENCFVELILNLYEVQGVACVFDLTRQWTQASACSVVMVDGNVNRQSYAAELLMKPATVSSPGCHNRLSITPCQVLHCVTSPPPPTPPLIPQHLVQMVQTWKIHSDKKVISSQWGQRHVLDWRYHWEQRGHVLVVDSGVIKTLSLKLLWPVFYINNGSIDSV